MTGHVEWGLLFACTVTEYHGKWMFEGSECAGEKTPGGNIRRAPSVRGRLSWEQMSSERMSVNHCAQQVAVSDHEIIAGRSVSACHQATLIEAITAAASPNTN